jgi:hypothetical protein
MMIGTGAAAAKRDCGTCTLCCKTMDVGALYKAAGKWCQFCTTGKGCGQYMLRPKQCRDFQCLWMMNQNFGPEWKPDRAKFVLTTEFQDKCLTIMVDPGQPHAWKRAPYRAVIEQMVIRQMSEGRIICIVDDHKRWLLLPEGPQELGPRKMSFDWTIKTTQTPAGPHFDIEISGVQKAA